MIGTRVSHYRILEKLGSGGMGEVYCAEDEHLSRRVAIKLPVLHDETGEYRARFLLEARAASQLTHPNIARIYDFGSAPDGRPFLVMELVDGVTLKEILRAGRMAPTKAAGIARGILGALAEAHSVGLVHRDIKPANIMLTSAGEVKVLDFGLAKGAPHASSSSPDEDLTVTGLTAPGGVAGTPAYMSPEQARGGLVDSRSDLFSTGLLVYQCLTGSPPFSGHSSRDVLTQVLTLDPAPPSQRVPELSRAWDRFVAKALQKDAGSRYQTATEMLHSVDSVVSETNSTVTRTVAALVGTKRRATSTAIAAAFLVCAGLLVMRGGRPHVPSAAAADWYRRGATALRDGTFYGAARMLQKAVELDPEFALAHARLAEAANELDDAGRAATEMLAALPNGAGSLPAGTDGMYVDAIHRTLTGDLAGAARAYRHLADKLQGPERAPPLVDLGRTYERSGQIPKAVETYREAIEIDGQNAAAHLRLGGLLARQLAPQAAPEFDRALSLYQAMSNTEGEAEVLFQRGLRLTQRDPAGARAVLEKSRDLAHAISSEPQEVAAILQLSAAAYVSGDVETGETLATEGLSRARKAGFTYLAARGLAELGNTNYIKRDWRRAEASYLESLDLARRFKLRRAEARALFGLANTHQTNGPVEDALREAAGALAYFREAGYQTEAMQCLLVLTRAHRDLGHGEEAVANVEQLLTAATLLEDAAMIAYAQQLSATVMSLYGRWPEAVRRFEEFRQSALARKDHANAVRALTGKAGVLWRLGAYADAQSALELASEAAGNAAAQERAPLLSSIQFRKAEIALSRERYPEALSIARGLYGDKTVSQRTALASRCIAAAAMAHTGRAAPGRQLCEAALAELMPSGDRFAIVEARLLFAQAALLQGDLDGASRAARQCIDETAQYKDGESGWRAWAILVRAQRLQGDAAGAAQSAQAGSRLLAAISWDPAWVRSYMDRPDIAVWRQEITTGK